MSYNLRNCSSRCSMDKILNRLETRRRDATRAKLSKEVGHNREEKKAPERKREGKGEEAGVAAKRKKKKDCRLAPFGQRFTPYPPFRFPSTLQQPLRSFFLCFFFESVPAVGFVRSSLFSLFATNKPHRNISLSSRLWNLAIIRNDLRIWLKKKKRESRRPYDSDVLTDCKKILIIILLFLSSS